MPRRPDLLPVLVVLGLAALFLAGWLAFPHVHAWLSWQDCVATGHPNCG